MAARKQTKKKTVKKSTGKRTNAKKTGRQIEVIEPVKGNPDEETSLKDEITILLLLAFCVIMVMSNFGITGYFGKIVSSIMFGLFGSVAYIFPFFLFFGTVFMIVNRNNGIAVVKGISLGILFLMFSAFFQLAWNGDFMTRSSSYDGNPYWNYAVENRRGGGFLGGYIFHGLNLITGEIGSVVVLLTISIICLVIITGKSFLKLIKNGSRQAIETARDSVDEAAIRRQQVREEREQDSRIKKERKPAEGHYMENTKISGEQTGKITDDEMHEITANLDLEDIRKKLENQVLSSDSAPERIINEEKIPDNDLTVQEGNEPVIEINQDIHEIIPDDMTPGKEVQTYKNTAKRQAASSAIPDGMIINHDAVHEYRLPPVKLLTKGKNTQNVNRKELLDTAKKLQETLLSFGVKVTMTDISQGPTVTRYEMLPEAGVKVSKILGLTDDIKLNLAAENIRIEAPIPGKAAIGIEVPNKDIQTIMLRDLIDSEEFKEAKSNLTFAVGKDIAGKTVVFDIAKMPHVLIAGATGSGKSVCINTIIMSILYKARPDEVKMIMVDPKVVELSIYNGIPHLLTPVVTDPQKAAGALQWGVAEMTKRYQQFADSHVRDLKGYNAKAEKEGLSKLPQIVIIVDELADLMMVAKNDVEQSICRLAQLARAAGIHLIIATQRPSVDVITGLIKANMPSRIAFTVTSGVDSRTILDINGAEKLLGKGDMLFYPTGYPKPARVQGAFVSDSEVQDVADFCKAQTVPDNEKTDISEEIEKATVSNSTATAAVSSDSNKDNDDIFMQAAEFAVNLDKETVSIGLLQRKFRIGFNRAARIMDQLCDEGIVGDDEGTKGRRIIMTPEKFEEFKEERA